MPRPSLLLPFLALLALARPSPAEPTAPADGDPRDLLLEQRAVRVGRNTASRHLSPEGLLAYEHRLGATPEQLSADALRKADTGIWTGCYAASVACRYAVTRDPEALALARRIAAGMDLLSAVTGVEGCITRAVGRPIEGEAPGTDTVPSAVAPGLWYRRDASRDTLSGLVLGWTALARFVDDPEVAAYAARNLGAIARRLANGGMNVRDPGGRVTSHGKLSPKVAWVVENGIHGAIGCAAILAGKRFAPGPDLDAAWRKLERDGWVGAVDAQHTWLGARHLSGSNVNMTHLALAVIGLEGEGRARKQAHEALAELRRKTRGWHNGGILALHLLSGSTYRREEVVEELRRTLIAMSPEEVPWAGTTILRRTGSIVPVTQRPNSVWSWKMSPDTEEVGREHAVRDPVRTYTRADWLFAYWLARAAGALAP